MHRFAILLLISLTLVACGNRHQAQTVTEFEHNHPHAKLDSATQFPAGQENTRTYVDRFPHINPDTGVYHVERRIYSFNHVGDTIIGDVAWGVE